VKATCGKYNYLPYICTGYMLKKDIFQHI